MKRIILEKDEYGLQRIVFEEDEKLNRENKAMEFIGGIAGVAKDSAKHSFVVGIIFYTAILIYLYWLLFHSQACNLR